MPRSGYKNTQATGHHGKIQPPGGVNSVTVKNSPVLEAHPHGFQAERQPTSILPLYDVVLN
jgi:hypothetical protein